eukprot:15477684-Alexandrium_andersonii.AAC.1
MRRSFDQRLGPASVKLRADVIGFVVRCLRLCLLTSARPMLPRVKDGAPLPWACRSRLVCRLVRAGCLVTS